MPAISRCERRVARGVDAVDAGADHRHRATAGLPTEPAASAPRWAAASTPSASPLTIVRPASARLWARPRHWPRPARWPSVRRRARSPDAATAPDHPSRRAAPAGRRCRAGCAVGLVGQGEDVASRFGRPRQGAFDEFVRGGASTASASSRPITPASALRPAAKMWRGSPKAASRLRWRSAPSPGTAASRSQSGRSRWRRSRSNPVSH